MGAGTQGNRRSGRTGTAGQWSSGLGRSLLGTAEKKKEWRGKPRWMQARQDRPDMATWGAAWPAR